MSKIYRSFFLLFLFFNNCSYFKSEESKVRDVCNAYMEGRRALENGDSLKIKIVTGDTIYRLIMLNQEYLKVLESSLGPADLNLYAKTAEIKGNKATCTMSGAESYKLNLYKTKDSWKVNGENDRFANPQAIAEIKKKIEDQKKHLKDRPKVESVIMAANRFFSDANNYFKSNDANTLKNNCDEDSADFVKRLYSYALKRSGSTIIKEEVNKPYGSSGQITFYSDKAIYEFYQESSSVLLQKKGDSYEVIGFNGIKSKQIDDYMMKDQYLQLLRAVRLLGPKQYRNKEIQ